ncbi:acyl-CoA dehydrogenase family protein [Micromonospora sp. NPDC049101]|uniref:acyl-CoA dehydrogenase family protein n=1 Tax=Micromonospora sp. NPDC049101 TaxID=3155032 RepID=UPI0033D8BFCF
MSTSIAYPPGRGGATAPRAGDPVAAAAALHDELNRRAAEAEASRQLPDDVVRSLREAGLFSLALPRRLGGREADPRTIVEVVELLSHADPAAGWSVLIGQGAGFLAWLAPEVADEIVAATPAPIVASSFAPLPPAVPAPGGHRLAGRWPYCSVSRHADWLMGAFLAPAPGGPPMLRFGFLPAGDWTVADTWDPAGLVATASNDVAVDGALLPERRTADPRTEAAREPGPLYRLSLFTLLRVCLAGFPLGVARRALDEITTIVTRKSRSASRQPLAADPLVQAELAHAEAAYQAARAGVLAVLDELWAQAQRGEAVDPVLRARFAASVQFAMRTALDVVESSFRIAGGGVLYRTGTLQRLWRDLQVAASHVVFGPDSVRRTGQALLGQDVPVALL